MECTTFPSEYGMESIVYLKSFDFDELFEAIDDEELVVFVVDGDIAGVEPSISIDSLPSSFLIVIITFHDLRTRDAEFTFLAGAQRLARCDVDDLEPGPGHGLAARADFIARHGAHVRHWRRFRHSETFLQDEALDVEPIHQFGGGGGAQRSGSAEDGVHPVESFFLPVVVVSQE